MPSTIPYLRVFADRQYLQITLSDLGSLIISVFDAGIITVLVINSLFKGNLLFEVIALSAGFNDYKRSDTRCKYISRCFMHIIQV